MRKKSAWLLHLIGDKVPPAIRDTVEVPRAINRRCYWYTENGQPSWCLSSYQSWSLGFSMPGPRHRGLTTMPTLFTCSLNSELTREYGAYGIWGKAFTHSFSSSFEGQSRVSLGYWIILVTWLHLLPATVDCILSNLASEQHFIFPRLHVQAHLLI